MTTTLKSYLDANPNFPVPAPVGGHIATIALIDGRYVMTGFTGTHSIEASCTDNERLRAHWDGFVETATEAHRTARWIDRSFAKWDQGT